MVNLPDIGAHYRIFNFEKNENPQNILVVYTKLDESCHFVKKDGQPFVDFYWLMEGKRYKPTHPLIKDAVRKRLQVSHVTDNQFELLIHDLKELNANSEQPSMTVRVERDASGCQVAGYFEEKAHPPIQVASIYSESKKTFLPPFRKLLAVTIRGTASGEAVQRKFVAK